MKHLSGKWIALDGVDAVGKSTQVQLLKQRIEAAGLPALVLPECSESPLGKTIQRIIEERRFYALHAMKRTPYADTYALIADAAYKIEAEGHDVLSSGGVVLSDRGILSLLGYQAKRVELHSGIAPTEAVERLTHVVRSMMEHLRLPDHHIFLTIEENVMQRRVVERGETLMEASDLKFMRDVREIMESLTADIDTSMIEVSHMDIEQVTVKILDILRARFTLPVGEIAQPAVPVPATESQ